MAKVTIGIPFHNAEATLADALRSVLVQTHTDWELILVDDGSTDSSLEIASTIADGRQVRIVSDGNRRGLAARLNQITELATTDYLFRMDADDMMHPRRLERQIEYMHRHQLELVGTSAFSITPNGKVRGLRGVPKTPPSSLEVFRKGLFIHPTIAGRRSWFLKNPYDESYSRAQDLELWVRTHQTLNYGYVETPLLFYREGTPRPGTYAANAAHTRRILKRYAPPLLGTTTTWMLIGHSLIKQKAYESLAALGLTEQIVRKRSRDLPPVEMEAAQTILNQICATPLKPARTANSRV